MNQDAALVLPGDHPRCFACASIALGYALTELDKNGERKNRKRQVLERRLALLRDTVPETATLTAPSALMAAAASTKEQAVALVVDLAFSVPFAPYELDFSERDFDKALRRTCAEMSFGNALVDRVLVLKGEAMRAHARRFFRPRWNPVLAGVSSVLSFPLLPAFLSGAASLAGAAGLAFLGGGSLAMGGFQMAGGAWVVAGLESAVSMAGVGVRQLMDAAPASVIRVEVAKCQTLVVLRMENDLCAKHDVAAQLGRLDELKQDVEEDLAEARKLNDPGAHRISELGEKVRALATGRDWIARRVR